MSLAPLLAASPAIQIHVIGAVLSMIGAVILLSARKGTPRHKLIGKLWVGTMTVTAISSFLIRDIRVIGDFSPIHLLSILTLFGLYQIVSLARAKKISDHKKAVNNLVFGALGVAGAFTFLPGRIMNAVFFSGESLLGFALVAIAVALLWVFYGTSKHIISRFTS